MFEKELKKYLKEHSKYDETFDMTFVICNTETVFKDAAKIGYDKAKRELKEAHKESVEIQNDCIIRLQKQISYAKTIIKDLLNNSDEHIKQRATDFLKKE